MKNITILDLRPTQFVLGMKEVEFKLEKIKKMDEKGLKKYCAENVIPIVIGPGKQYFLIDHHHFARSCWEQKIQFFKIKVVKDLSLLTEKEFWNVMISKKWTYLYDQFGLGPHSPYDLPINICYMADDKYRSLAWSVRNAGFIKKSSKPFYEFEWARFFKLNLNRTLKSETDFNLAFAESKKLALSNHAKNLPGYCGK